MRYVSSAGPHQLIHRVCVCGNASSDDITTQRRWHQERPVRRRCLQCGAQRQRAAVTC